MAKQLNMNLTFTADTSQAKAQIKDLNNTLDTLIKGSATTQLPLTKELQQAQSAAATLKVALNQAFNEKTGKLDLTQFSDSLRKADLDAAKLRQTFEAFGPAGNQAFMSLSKSIATAELPLRRTNTLMTELWTTMKNTARWQLSSTILHGFMGTVQSALYYARDLDESLNNIRIVTGYSAGEMASFAEQANKAAKALSTTTTKYTDASLIYFQQGLDKEQVAEMADITVRMANVTGQSSQIVSDQLTAIWNNFNKSGEESYEKYADVLTALGAATASSTDEIAGGLEKFASIADMIGLSYEYAASALATITATTRQSEDVVGTALKTIFARIQGLSLGETLDDGTDLNKYSKALEKVGISIFDQNNQLKDMDLIIDEIGNKWSTLNKDQQVALAQTVAGVRQYNQLVSLFDNWDYFGENLNVAMTAEGELDKQAEIYAESWQAARDRVKAAAEDIYDSILDDKAFITMLNTFEKLISMIGTFTESIGGLPGVIGLVGIALTKAFGPQLTASLDNIVYKFNSLTGANAQTARNVKNQFLSEAEKISYDDGTNAGAATAEALKNQVNLQQQINNMDQSLTETERQRLQVLLDINAAYGQQAIQQGKLLDQAKQEQQQSARELRNRALRSGASREDFQQAQTQAGADVKAAYQADKSMKQLANKKATSYSQIAIQALNVEKQLKSLDADADYTKGYIKLRKELAAGKISVVDFQKSLKQTILINDVVNDGLFRGAERFTSLNERMAGAGKQADAWAERLLQALRAQDSFNQSMRQTSTHAQAVQNAFNNLKSGVAGFSQNLVSVANGMSQLTMGTMSLVSAFKTIGNEDMSFGDKLLSVTLSLSMAIPMLITGFSQLAAVEWASIAADAAKIKSGLAQIPAIFAQETAIGKLIQSKIVDRAATYAGVTASQLSIVAQIKEAWQTKASAAAFLKKAAAILVAKSALMTFLGIVGLVAVAVAGLVVAIKKYQEAQNADAIAADNAATAARNLAEAYNEAKSSYEEMISAMNNYQSARDGLDSLTKGTQEYNEALKEANRQALELIQNYPQFFSPDDYSWQDGELIIDEGAMRNAQLEQQAIMDKAYAASTMANLDAQDAQRVSDTTDLYRKIEDQGTELPGGLLTKAIEMGAEDSGIFANKEYMAEKLEIEGNDQLISALWANVGEISALSTQLAANTAAREVSSQEIVREALNSYDSPVKTSAYKEEVAAAANKSYNKDYQKRYDAIYEDLNSGLNNDKQEDYMKRYAEASGLGDKKGYKAEMDYDGTLKYSYIDEETGERTEEKEVTTEEISSTLATSEALNGLVTTAGVLNSTMANLANEISKEEAGAPRGFLTGEGASKKSLEAAQIKVDEVGAEEYLKEAFSLGDTIDPEELEALGYESAEELVSAFQAYLDNSQVSWDGMDFMDQFDKTKPAETQFIRGEGEIATAPEIPPLNLDSNQKEALSSISLEAAQSIENAFNQISMGPLGEQGGRDYLQGLMNAIKGMDSETATKALEELAKVDFSDTEAGLEQTKEILSKFGVNVNEASEAWQSFENVINNTNFDGAGSQLRTLQDDLIALKGILGEEGLMAGTEVSKEDMETLVNAGTATEDDFLFTGTGYEYVGEQITMENQGLQQQLQLLQERKALYEDYLNSVQNEPEVAEMDFKDLSENGTSKELQNAVDILQESDTMAPILESLGIAQEKLDSMNDEQLRKVMATIQEFLSMGADGTYDQLSDEIWASTAEDLAQLEEMYQSGDISVEAYNKGLEKLKNTLDEDIDVDEWENLSEYIEENADKLEDYDDELKNNPKLAKKAASELLRYNNAIEDVTKNYDKWMKGLKNKTLQNSAADMEELKDAYGDLLNLDGSTLSDEFLTSAENLDLMKQAIQGNEDAYDQLCMKVLQETLKPGLDASDVYNQLDQLVQDVAGVDIDDIEVGANLIDMGLQEGLNQLVNSCWDSAAAAQEGLMSMGIDATVVEATGTVEDTETYQGVEANVTDNSIPIVNPLTMVQDSISAPSISYSPGATQTVTHTKQLSGAGLEVTEASKAGGGGVKYKNASLGGGKRGGSGGGGGGGGGGGKSTPAKRPTRTHKREVWNPFRDTDKALERIADAMEDVEKRIDRLYGKNRVDAINKVNQALEDQIAKLKEQKVVAQDELKYDKAWLNQIAKENGLGENAFTFDETKQGAVSNYSKIMKPLWTKLHEIEDVRQKWFKEGKTEEAIEAEMERLGYDDLQTRISNVEAALGVYDESVEKLREVENAIADAFYEWQDNNYDKLHYTLELKIEVEEMDLAYIEYMLDKMSDDFWSMAEAAKQMVLSADNYERILEADEAFYNDLNTAYMHGEISQEAYLEGLKETFDNILDTLSSLNQLDKDMLEYYANSLDAASDELAHYTDQLEHLTDVLDHYRNIIEMVNGEFAYDQIDTVLRGQSQTIKNELDVATKTYEMLQREKEAIEASLATAEDDAAAKVFQEELMAIEESLMEAHANMLDKTEAWAEIELEIFENTMAKAARTMELAMTDNMGFDSLSNSIDRLSSYAEVYLTKTNQIYEMQTLINKATTESDKITNKAAQNRLQAFIKETEALKEKNQLSNLELDIQKAKYELLLAEIALEEAQNAKATVRLKRDSEGNFGYVYTADQEAIGEAEQEVLDAQNRLYNIGLDGANEYGEKMLQLRQEHADALIDLEERRAAGEFATDELYNTEKERINREYYALMEAYSEQYTIALGVHNAIQEDAWVNAYEGMITKTDEWQLAVVEYTENCENAFSTYKQTLKDGSDIIKTALDDIKTVTGEVTDESDRLAREIQNDLLPHMEDQLIAVRAQTTAYGEQRDTILDLIDKYEKLADTIRGQVREQSTMDSTLKIKDYSYEMSKIIANGEEGGMNSERFKQLSNARVEKIATEGTTQDWIEHDTLLKLFEAAEDGNEKAMNYVKAIANKETFYSNKEAEKILGLATGGYTGAWGSEGRIALLHEKELVLNASDTSNFLKALDIMREITKSIDLENLRQQYAFAINSIPSIGQGFAETIEQNVHIEANFPAVQDRNEIEEAFNNLINTASQFANRKKL